MKQSKKKADTTQVNQRSLWGDSLANLSASQGNNKLKTTIDTFGRKCCELSDRLNRLTLWQKTLRDYLLLKTEWRSSLCVNQWRMKGTKYSRLLFLLVPSEPPTVATGSGLLPTPACFNGTRNGRKSSTLEQGGKHAVTLMEMGAKGFLPTPIASDCGEKLTGKESQDSLTKRARNQTGKTFQLNHRFLAEMMGFPPDWTDSAFQSLDENQ